MLVADLMSKMHDDSGIMCPGLRSKVSEMFDRLSGGQQTMSRQQVEAWLLMINKQLGRGSEYRKAVALMEANDDGDQLSREQLIEVYESELGEGKYWGVEHVSAHCCSDLNPC